MKKHHIIITIIMIIIIEGGRWKRMINRQIMKVYL